MNTRLHAIAAILETVPAEQREALRPLLRALVEEGREVLRTKEEELALKARRVAELERRVRLQAKRMGELQQEAVELQANRHRWRGDVEAAYRAHNETRRELEEVQGRLEDTLHREAQALAENVTLTVKLEQARTAAGAARAALARAHTQRMVVAAGRTLATLAAQALAAVQAPWKLRPHRTLAPGAYAPLDCWPA